MMIAPAGSTGGNVIPLSSTTILIILVVALIGLLAVVGWRSPDRSPHADDKAERDRIDD